MGSFTILTLSSVLVPQVQTRSELRDVLQSIYDENILLLCMQG
jgi:SepF-like predicted cell division protein (DUF552 family)